MAHARCLTTGSAILFLAAALAPVVLLAVSLAGGAIFASGGSGVGMVEGAVLIFVRQVVLSEAGVAVWLIVLLVSVAGMGFGARQLREGDRED